LPNKASTKEIAEYVSKKGDISMKEARAAIKLTFEGLATQLKKAERVNVSGVGSFSKTIKPAQKGGKKVWNPFAQQYVLSKPKPASVKIKFRPGKGFKTQIGGRK